MDLTQERPGEHHYIHSVSESGIRVVDQICEGAFIVSANRLILDWPVTTPADIDARHLKQVFELEPELVLIGTGAEQVFLKPELLMEFYGRSVGIEVMTTQAACRTFNVLVSEGRKVVAAILPHSS
jgi:uncharacterized protein